MFIQNLGYFIYNEITCIVEEHARTQTILTEISQGYISRRMMVLLRVRMESS
jgi:hypothetical protein